MKRFQKSSFIIIFIISLLLLYVPNVSADEAGDHVWSEWITDIPPTCDTPGHRYRICTATPGYSHMEEQIITPYGHKWGEWITIREATAKEEGLMRRICAYDPSHIEEMPIPKLPPEAVTEPAATISESSTVPPIEAETVPVAISEPETVPETIPMSSKEPESESETETAAVPLPPTKPASPDRSFGLDIVLGLVFISIISIISRILFCNYRLIRWDKRKKQALHQKKKGGIFCNVYKQLD